MKKAVSKRFVAVIGGSLFSSMLIVNATVGDVVSFGGGAVILPW
ncbi:hypothetical protein [Paenibacillus sp. 481]|nr:hypothetical protein [Paenibacillus sp. 481]